MGEGGICSPLDLFHTLLSWLTLVPLNIYPFQNYYPVSREISLP